VTIADHVLVRCPRCERMAAPVAPDREVLRVVARIRASLIKG
jgi:hypothetical protein